MHRPNSGRVTLIQSKNHAANKGKMACRYQFDTHLTGIELRTTHFLQRTEEEDDYLHVLVASIDSFDTGSCPSVVDYC